MKRFIYRVLRKLKLLPQKSFVQFHYKFQTGKKLDLQNPKEFNEKIQWLKIYYKPSILTQLVDKYGVRAYVSEKIGEKYLNKVYGVYNNAAEIDFDSLPERFVLKATHGYNMNLIVKDKSQLDVPKARETAQYWLSINHYYYAGREWAYKNVNPRLIAENYLEQKNRQSINDYKFFCFDGEPKFLQVDIERSNNHSVGYFNLEWERQPFSKIGNPPVEENLEKPENFEEMVAVVRKLAADFPFVRVDLYNIDGRIVFGEMTFYPADGRTRFDPEEYNSILGEYINLPTIPKGQKAITLFTPRPNHPQTA